jgi:hypothetical protein
VQTSLWSGGGVHWEFLSKPKHGMCQGRQAAGKSQILACFCHLSVKQEL